MTNTDIADTPPASPSGRSEHRMTVRITQRTADFEIPTGTSQNGHPIEIVRAGMHSAFTTRQHQDAPAREAPSPQALQNDPQPAIPGPSAADGDATVLEPLDLKAEPDLATILEPEETVAEPLETVHAPFPEDTDIEEISRRFAPQREIN